jgi:hypothetical protein
VFADRVAAALTPSASPGPSGSTGSSSSKTALVVGVVVGVGGGLILLGVVAGVAVHTRAKRAAAKQGSKVVQVTPRVGGTVAGASAAAKGSSPPPSVLMEEGRARARLPCPREPTPCTLRTAALARAQPWHSPLSSVDSREVRAFRLVNYCPFPVPLLQVQCHSSSSTFVNRLCVHFLSMVGLRCTLKCSLHSQLAIYYARSATACSQRILVFVMGAVESIPSPKSRLVRPGPFVAAVEMAAVRCTVVTP